MSNSAGNSGKRDQKASRLKHASRRKEHEKEILEKLYAKAGPPIAFLVPEIIALLKDLKGLEAEHFFLTVLGSPRAHESLQFVSPPHSTMSATTARKLMVDVIRPEHDQGEKFMKSEMEIRGASPVGYDIQSFVDQMVREVDRSADDTRRKRSATAAAKLGVKLRPGRPKKSGKK